MTRVKGGLKTKQKHKKVLKMTKGYWMSRSSQIRKAKEAILHAGEYAFAGRKLKKRQFRRLWITRINAALSKKNIKYNTFIHLLKIKKIEIDRKILSQLALEKPNVFDNLISRVTDK